MSSTSLNKFILYYLRLFKPKKYFPPPSMNINAKNTDNTMVGSLCGYITYRNHLSPKGGTFGMIVSINPVEENTI